MAEPNTYRAGPDDHGHFGMFGGRYVAETLMPLILELEKAYGAARKDPGFAAELAYYFRNYVGRPSPLYLAARLTARFGGAKVYLKRDELNHTGAHKINNCIGQILLARRMGKTRIIAETGAGQHGGAGAAVPPPRVGVPAPNGRLQEARRVLGVPAAGGARCARRVEGPAANGRILAARRVLVSAADGRNSAVRRVKIAAADGRRVTARHVVPTATDRGARGICWVGVVRTHAVVSPASDCAVNMEDAVFGGLRRGARG